MDAQGWSFLKHIHSPGPAHTAHPLEHGLDQSVKGKVEETRESSRW